MPPDPVVIEPAASAAERLTALSDALMAALDPDGRVTWANPAWHPALGLRPAGLLGLPLGDLVAVEEQATFAAALSTAAVHGRGRADVHVRGGDGALVRCSLHLVADPATGGTLLSGRPVPPEDEERRRLREALVFSDARYQALITHLDDLAIVLFDHDLRLQLVDGERLRRDGLDLRAFEGRRFEDVLPPERYARVADEYRAVLRGEHRAFLLETPDDAPDYWVDAVPIRDEEGRIAGGMAIGLDITERRRAERALEDRARELERSNEELEQFAYVASHDLSEPLRMVSSYLQLLRRRYHGRLDQDADEFIEFAVDGATRMRALIEDLLAYSRAGRADRPLEPVDLGEVVGRVVDDLHAAGITLVATVAQLPTVPGDPAQLHQLFANLLGNACKFVAPGRIPAVSVHVLPGEGHWRFVVDDNGIGFDPDHVDRMFRMFQRLHTREAYAGTGIGLAIAKKVVERHGGEIAAFPRPEGGSRFTFTLPVEGP